MALNYCLYMPNVACVIPGFRNLRQVQCNLAGEGKSLTAADIEYIKQALAD
jgi:aryl-alcohol dehydrogenase-like predicted oxidoreductase